MGLLHVVIPLILQLFSHEFDDWVSDRLPSTHAIVADINNDFLGFCNCGVYFLTYFGPFFLTEKRVLPNVHFSTCYFYLIVRNFFFQATLQNSYNSKHFSDGR